MTFEEFDKKIKEIAQSADSFLDRVAADEVESAALRFVDDNFVNQSWEGKKWEETANGKTMLVATGALKRGFVAERSHHQIKIVNSMPYAKTHNEGSHEIVTVKAHSRGVYTGKRSKRKRTGRVSVKSHKRKMNIKERQFAPYPGSESPTLNAEVQKIISNNIEKLWKL